MEAGKLGGRRGAWEYFADHTLLTDWIFIFFDKAGWLRLTASRRLAALWVRLGCSKREDRIRFTDSRSRSTGLQVLESD
jgi:hypothetical protein